MFMVFEPKGKGRLNCFALVTYIPDPLAKFLDDLRKELVPGCAPHAHVTVLPPRPITAEGDAAAEAARIALLGVPAFELEAGEIEVFPATNVVYLSISKGLSALQELHELANKGPVVFEEPFPYHPHITLAQDLNSEQCAQLEQVARKRWAEYCQSRQSRRIPVEILTFVQCTVECKWLDLAQLPLATGVPAVR